MREPATELPTGDWLSLGPASELLGIDPDTAAIDACMMEHAVSPLTVNRMRALLERVRAGRVTGLAQRGRRRDAGACSRCEVLGACQAENLSAKS